MLTVEEIDLELAMTKSPSKSVEIKRKLPVKVTFENLEYEVTLKLSRAEAAK